ncbi:hypothetical protein [Achromobacter marplatensis]|uniref:hypothetical protein n=1 Tax=Achromobacter marplatensis TaxID=470868 RepID=UPI0028E1E5D0|nr:hypothetical protein [Achromobacter marplatensis]
MQTQTMRAPAASPFLPDDPAEELIMTWYYWARSHREFLGYSNGSPMFRAAKSGMTRDPQTEKDERELRIARLQAQQVDVCIDSLPSWQMRAAVDIHAANKAAGNRVLSNPRLSPEQLHAAYQEAKERLIPMFIRRGLMADPLASR